jgi:purine-cytosine permease-like protein
MHGAGIRGIEVRSIDWIPENERHGKVWHQAPLWFLGNFQYFTIPIGFIGPSLGLSLWWTILAGTAGILVGTVFMAFHATQGPTLGLPQMIQSRAQFGFRGVIVALFAMVFTYMAFNVADQVLLAQGLHGAFGWNATAVAVVVTAGAYVFAGASTPAIWLIALGAWLAISLGATDGLVGLQTAGNHVISHLGGITGFLSAVALAATMGMNAYGATLTTLAGVDAFRKVKPTRRARVVTIAVLTVIWFVIAELITTSAVGVVDTVLTLMLYLLVPWTVINLIDFFVVRRGHYAITDLFRPDGIYGVWSRRGLTAYFVGFAAEIPFMVLLNLVTFKSYYTGPLASLLNSVDISWIVGAVVTAVVYLLLTRNLDVAAEQAAVASSDAELHRVASAVEA